MSKSFGRMSALGALALLGIIWSGPVWAQFDAGRVAAAKKEGALVFYSANLPELLQTQIAKFGDRFPGIKVEIVRLANSPLIARVESEAATNKLTADLVETTDVSDAKRIEALFEDYAPANAAKFPPASQISKRFWPLCGAAYVLMVNTALVSKPPTTLAGLLDPAYKGKVGTVVPGAGGTSWANALMQRLVAGDDYWAKFATQQPMLYLSSVPLGTAVASGEIAMGFAPLIAVAPLQKQGAPVAAIGLDDGIPAAVTTGGVVKGAKNPNAARLFLDWATSEEVQKIYVDLGCASVLPGMPLPSSMKAEKGKVWVPPFQEYAARQQAWVAEWNKTNNYNQ